MIFISGWKSHAFARANALYTSIEADLTLEERDRLALLRSRSTDLW
jgi:hypothetical protein